MRDYNQALQIDSNNAEAYTLRGDAQADQAQFAQAVQDYQAAVRREPRLRPRVPELRLAAGHLPQRSVP